MVSHPEYHYVDNVLKHRETGEGFKWVNQAHYDHLGDYVTLYIQERMVQDFGMEEILVPLPEDCPEPDCPKCNIFMTPNARTCETLVLVIEGSGAVTPGMWARSLCINDTLETGTILPYLRRIRDNGWGAVVFNPNGIPAPTMEQPAEGEQTKNKKVVIPHHETGEAHTRYVFDRVVAAQCNQYRNLLIVAHSYGGVCTHKLIVDREEALLPRLRAVAFTDSVHQWPSSESSTLLRRELIRQHRAMANHELTEEEINELVPPVPAPSRPVAQFFAEHVVNWLSRSTPLDTEDAEYDEGCKGVSAGTPKHERTSAACIDSVFALFDAKLAAVPEQ
eukprot:gnl/Trimastix_PCT/3243.p2 GENE.gnl/Trimastix_PCT/3243~~gnl/Trimastix_PCT/3243.p2  ORF type:complete len:350 (-),score=88.23 gnl/Trimastix_PCT/3243:95-1096(-)